MSCDNCTNCNEKGNEEEELDGDIDCDSSDFKSENKINQEILKKFYNKEKIKEFTSYIS